MRKLLEFFMPSRPDRSLADLERAYLNASVSRYDLERREREIDQGLFRRGSGLSA